MAMDREIHQYPLEWEEKDGETTAHVYPLLKISIQTHRHNSAAFQVSIEVIADNLYFAKEFNTVEEAKEFAIAQAYKLVNNAVKLLDVHTKAPVQLSLF